MSSGSNLPTVRHLNVHAGALFQQADRELKDLEERARNQEQDLEAKKRAYKSAQRQHKRLWDRADDLRAKREKLRNEKETFEEWLDEQVVARRVVLRNEKETAQSSNGS